LDVSILPSCLVDSVDRVKGCNIIDLRLFMATEYSNKQAFASFNFPLRMPCWNILSIGHCKGVNSLDLHCRVILCKGVNSCCAMPLRSFLSKPLVTCTLSCCRCIVEWDPG
jgi:hypothetical protein